MIYEYVVLAIPTHYKKGELHMKWNPRNCLTLAVGAALGATLCGGASAAVTSLTATPSANPIYVDGQQVQMEAYKINGNNYVKLRDVGKVIGFNVFWDSGVQIDSDADYTGEAPCAAVERPVQDVESVKQEMIDRTNALRRENGIATLTVSDRLMEAAQVRAEEMAATTTYSHTRPDGSKYNTVTNCPYTAENIHRISIPYLESQNQELADFAVTSWANSEGHRKNMLNAKVSSIGVGLAKGVNDSGQECWYCVQLFLYDGYTISSIYALSK